MAGSEEAQKRSWREFELRDGNGQSQAGGVVLACDGRRVAGRR